MPTPVFKLIDFPFCRVLTIGAWNAEPGRYFLSYRTRHAFRHLLGHPVVDEYRTVSSPIFFTPCELLGKVYNVGISLGHKRDHEMALDMGWPPLCVGLDQVPPKLPDGWEAKLLSAVSGGPASKPASEKQLLQYRTEIGNHTLERWKFGDQVVVFGTTAPLLPEQLKRLCETVDAPLVMAMATGNRIVRVKPTEAQSITVASESQLGELLNAAGKS